MKRLGAWVLVLTCITAASAMGDDWPQWLGSHRDGVWRETGIIEKFPPAGVNIRWRVPVGSGYSSPSVAGGKVFVIDRKVSEGSAKPSNPFAKISTPGVERVVCLDEATGKTIWVQEYPCAYTMSYQAGPRAAPLIDGPNVYTSGAEGDLQCRKVADGQLVWQKHLGGEHTPMWGFAASPLVYQDELIAIGGDPAATVLAFNKNTGAELWRAVPAKEPGYSSPIVIEAGGKPQLIVWNPQSLNSLDPTSGKMYWSLPVTAGAGMSIATPRRSGDLLFVTNFYNGAMMVQLDPNKPEARQLWKIGGKNERKTEALHCVLSTPFIKDGYIYGVDSYGQLRCLEAATGKRIWETFDATTGSNGPVRWANAFIVPNGNRYFLFNESGDLIIADLSPRGYHEVSRAHLIDPLNTDPGRPVVWCQPAFADRCVFVRNDRELVCASLAAQ
ncbi:MAG TPA: PQQ-binding-like beta-propeller repeat protein [Tepidisphaeraceae bacterium]|nr:PQQ-binding-like beta-propeller repeat protein [Tepidisphaeraceae bacterium]